MKDKIASLLKPDAKVESKLSVISLFIGKMLDKFDRRIINLEERQLQKGDKGDKGDSGQKGDAGRDGRDGKDGKDGRDGIGKDGKNGRSGVDGKDGVSVLDADIAVDDHLVLKLSNGDIIDAGELPKARAIQGMSVSGNAWQITVSANAPSNPQLNDLWLDI